MKIKRSKYSKNLIAILICVLVVFSFLFIHIAWIKANPSARVRFTADTIIDLSSLDTTLYALSGSECDLLTINDSLLTVDIPETSSFTLATALNNVLRLTPSGGTVSLIFSSSYFHLGYVSQWQEASSTSDLKVDHLVGVSKANTWYDIKVDGLLFNSFKSNEAGELTFTYDAGYSPKVFVVEEKILPLKHPEEISEVPRKSLGERLSQGTVNILKAILPKGVAEFYEKKIIQNKTVQAAIQAAAVPIITATSAGITALAAANTSIASGSYLLYLWQFLGSPLAYFSRRKRKAWGIVYNSLTKQPVDLAMVRLWDAKTKKLLQTKVTGRDGRYMFLVKKDKEYYVTVAKPDYEYPSRMLEGAERDIIYQNLYYYQIIAIDPSLTSIQRKKERIILPREVINLNIPLDPHQKTVFSPGLTYGTKSRISYLSDFLGLSRRERNKENQALISSYKKAALRRSVSNIGPVLGFICFILSPSWYTFSLFIVQLLVCFLFRRLALRRQPKPWGKVKDRKTDRGLDLAVLRLFNKRYGRLLLTQVTPRKGRYGFLVGKENYLLTCERQGYQTPPKLEILGTKEGIVRKDIGMRKV